MSKWYIEAGDSPEVVVSTRVRFARNLRKYPFPIRLDEAGRKEVCELVADTVLNGNATIDKEFKYCDMSKLSSLETERLVERHLISPDFAASCDGEGLLLTNDESVSLMLCEEDHIRIQVMKSGLALEAAFETADKLDTLLDSRLGFAYDEKLGYLTQCPTNLGTGMRASVMLHLPALEEASQIQPLANTVSRLGLAIRGTYGEGSKAQGAFYQLSNQVTLGISEEAALNNLKSITKQLIARELELRNRLLSQSKLEDNIFRAYGILLYARSVSTKEFMELVSLIRLGNAMGILNIGYNVINELIQDCQPATLLLGAGKELDEVLRDKLRATIIREKLSSQSSH